MKTVKEIEDAGGHLVHTESWATWNDGGRGTNWFYRMPDGRHYKVHQASDYSSDVKISEVVREKRTTYIYLEAEGY